MVGRVREVEIERHGELKLILGGLHGYERVRGGQGPNKDQYHGYTKDKKHSTATFFTPREAAIALAELKRDLAAGLDKAARKRRKREACKRLGSCPNPYPILPSSTYHILTLHPVRQCVPQIKSTRPKIRRRRWHRRQFCHVWSRTWPLSPCAAALQPRRSAASTTT